MRMPVLCALGVLAAACGQQAPGAPAPVASSGPAAPAPGVPVASADPAPGVVNQPPAEVGAKLAGQWRAIDDEKSLLTISSDGTWTSEYAGDDSVHDVARWRAFAGTQAPKDMANETFTASSTYIEVSAADGSFYYELGDVSADAFEMFYVGRGNRLAYRRLK